MGVPTKEICCGCETPIEDRFLLRVADQSWHETCLRCSVCLDQLNQSCFIKDGQPYCKNDYDRLFGVRCSRCLAPIPPHELVMRAVNYIYHVQCFVCVICRRQLHKGDHFVLNNANIYCRLHYEPKPCHFFQLSPNSNDWYNSCKSDDDSSLDDGDADQPKGPKRPRTILTTSQRRKFKASFEVNSKPCRKVRETLAAETGLSVRVVQVWFQNQRAKMKKLARRQTEDNQSGSKDKKSSTNNKNMSKKNRDDEILQSPPAPLSDCSCDVTGLTSEKRQQLESSKLADNNNQIMIFNVTTNSREPLFGISSADARSSATGVYEVLAEDQPITAGDTLESLSLLITNCSNSGKSGGTTTTQTGNPIDKLYSMQTSYFTN